MAAIRASRGCLTLLDRFAKYTPDELQMEGPYTMLRGTFLNPSGTEALVPSAVLVPFLMFEGDMQAAGINRQLGRITTSNILSFDTREPANTHVRQLDSIFDIRDRDLRYQRCADHNAKHGIPADLLRRSASRYRDFERRHASDRRNRFDANRAGAFDRLYARRTPRTAGIVYLR